MKRVQIELSDPVAAQLDALVKEGWFRDEEELLRYALTEFVRRNELAMMRKHQLADIERALQEHGAVEDPV